MNYDDFFADALMRLHEEGRYRVFANLERIARCFPARSGIRRAARVASSSGVPTTTWA